MVCVGYVAVVIAKTAKTSRSKDHPHNTKHNNITTSTVTMIGSRAVIFF